MPRKPKGEPAFVRDIVISNYKAAGIILEPEEFIFYNQQGEYSRNWRFDFVVKDYKIAIEIEGGVFFNVGHRALTRFKEDILKYNSAASLGWLVFRTVPSQSCMNEMFDWVKAGMKAKGKPDRK